MDLSLLLGLLKQLIRQLKGRFHGAKLSFLSTVVTMRAPMALRLEVASVISDCQVFGLGAMGLSL